MRRLASVIIIAAAVAAATTASAQGARLSDVQYIKAARCAGLASAETLGSTDGSAFDAMLKAQSRGRESYILDKADSARKGALKAAARADDGAKVNLIAERDGACKSFLD